ncbi:MAG: family 78 glycoside hydrolase catalytic domain [Candidatus Omnitrophota bacterium]
MEWKANWLWAAGRGKAVNQYLYARKVVEIPGAVNSAQVYCACFSRYKLYVNGKYVGRGPSHCNPAWQYYDEYGLAGYLRPGRNVIAVICYNYGIGTHNRPYCRGGFLFQGEIFSDKEKIAVFSDSSWKVSPETPWAQDSPRLFFPAGFQEIYDKRKESRWLDPDFDDSSWEEPEIIGRPPVAPWLRLIPREIPPLRETASFPESILRIGQGERPDGLFNINFDRFLAPDENGIVYALTYLYSAVNRKAQLTLACDDAFKAWINEKSVLTQNGEGWTKWIPDEKETYHQFHKGYGWPKEIAGISLRRGWNKILVKVSQGVKSWGFLFYISPLSAGIIGKDMFYSSRKEYEDAESWMLAGPFPETLKEGKEIGLETTYPPEKEIDFSKSYPSDDRRARWKPFGDERTVIEVAGFMKKEKKSLAPENLFANPSAILSDNEEFAEVRTEGQKSTFILCDFGREVTGYPKVEIAECRGGILDLGYSEWLDEKGNIDPTRQNIKQADRFILAEGPQTIQTFSRRAFRYLQLTFRSCPGSVKIRDVEIISVNYPVEYKGLFHCSDELLNSIWKVSRYTLQLCMQDHYEDCPLRERAQYCGDMRVEAMENYYAFGDYKLSGKGLKQFIQSQEPSGWFRADYPSATYHQIVDYCAVWVLALYDYYFYTGDIRLVSELYPNLLAVLGWLEDQLNERKLISKKEQWWVFIDWAEMDNRGEVTGFQMFYYQALLTAAKLSSALGDRKQANRQRRLADRIKASINRYLWSDKKGAYVDCCSGGRQSPSVSYPANCLAILFGVADDRKSRKIHANVFNNPAVKPLNAPYFYFYFLDTLFNFKKDKEAVLRTRDYYGRMLEHGATTWWEWFEPGAKVIPREDVSLCHAYSSAPAYIFPSRILGVRPLEPGFSRFCVAPMLGGLTWAEGKVPTPKGIITVYWKRDLKKNSLEIEITAPEGCQADVLLPEIKFSETIVRVNGELKKSGRIRQKRKGGIRNGVFCPGRTEKG